MARHGQKVTLNQFCQGGFSTVSNILTGKLDGLVDAFITCIEPMDGTKSKGLSKFLDALPEPLNDLDSESKTLASGNEESISREKSESHKRFGREKEDFSRRLHVFRCQSRHQHRSGCNETFE